MSNGKLSGLLKRIIASSLEHDYTLCHYIIMYYVIIVPLCEERVGWGRLASIRACA